MKKLESSRNYTFAFKVLSLAEARACCRTGEGISSSVLFSFRSPTLFCEQRLPPLEIKHDFFAGGAGCAQGHRQTEPPLTHSGTASMRPLFPLVPSPSHLNFHW